MTKNIPIGVDNFNELVDPASEFLFIDKTNYIAKIIDDKSKSILITRPRRWGKTINFSMLQHFFASEVNGYATQALFKGLDIETMNNGAYMQHQGQYPVIFLTFKELKVSSYRSTIEAIRELIRDLVSEHDYLMKSNKVSDMLKKSLSHLTERNASAIVLSQTLKKDFFVRCGRYESQTALEIALAEAKHYYNGYEVNGVTLYNPWSIVSYVKNGEARPYWVNTGNDTLIKRHIVQGGDAVQQDFSDLMEGKCITRAITPFLRFDQLDVGQDGLWTVLLYAGYLKAQYSEANGLVTDCDLVIPNQEILYLYQEVFKKRINLTTGQNGTMISILPEN